MTNWRQIGWCDKCEWTLNNGGPGNGIVCSECGFDSRRAQVERYAEEAAAAAEGTLFSCLADVSHHAVLRDFVDADQTSVVRALHCSQCEKAFVLLAPTELNLAVWKPLRGSLVARAGGCPLHFTRAARAHTAGQMTLATLADHYEPHSGSAFDAHDWDAFYPGWP